MDSAGSKYVFKNSNAKIGCAESNSYVFARYRPLLSPQSPDSCTMCWNPLIGFLPWVRQLGFAFVTLASWRHQVKALCSLVRRRSALKTMRTGYVGGRIAPRYVTTRLSFRQYPSERTVSSGVTVTGLRVGRLNKRGSIFGTGKTFLPPQKQWLGARGVRPTRHLPLLHSPN